MDPAGLGFLLGFLGLFAGLSCFYVYERIQQRRQRQRIPITIPLLVGQPILPRKAHWKVKMLVQQKPVLNRQKALRKIELTS